MAKTSRRDFLKIGAALAGATGASPLVASIERAMAIAPAPGSSYLDAEHVVILMQENRSFDHAFGALRGVRGFDDPRAIRLADGNPVWVQTNDAGASFAPFRLGLLDTKSTWMGCLPHSWTDQVDARNGGRHDRWLQAKASGDEAYAHLPLTMGYYDRQDIPFYYELADAFTICDQHFCSSLTGTTPNRSYLWTGTIRPKPDEQSPAHLHNSEIDYGAEVSWPTFPERLEELGVSWKVYQNELYLDVGFTDEQAAWLGNFGDNPLEYFAQYHPRFAASHRRVLEARVAALRNEFRSLEFAAGGREVDRREQLLATQSELAQAQQELDAWSEERFRKLSPREQALHAKAFCTNAGDPNHRELTEFTYEDRGRVRRVEAPKGDILHQFRRDVDNGELPTVSWLVAPERFSDHPGSAWYGAWYIAETLNILTKNPDVWRKTVFILTYDENDGYFDHIPPFVPPHPRRPESGRVSHSLNAALDYVDGELEAQRRSPDEVRDSPIGLGYRVPMVIASPWSRGGWVCSQVFDHTSPLQFVERLLSHRLDREVKEPNISNWRRAVCGDLTAAFQTNAGSTPPAAWPLKRNEYVELIHRAQFKDAPAPGAPLSTAELEAAKQSPRILPRLPSQEPGTRPSCALPYELVAEGALSKDRQRFTVRLEARTELFGDRAAGAPFTIYASPGSSQMQVRNYAVAAGESVEDSWSLSDFTGGRYHLAIVGPNGFYREFRGDASAPLVELRVDSSNNDDDRFVVMLEIANREPARPLEISIEDASYGGRPIQRRLAPGEEAAVSIDTKPGEGWFDFRVRAANAPGLEFRYAGRIETGRPGVSDPLIGRRA